MKLVVGTRVPSPADEGEDIGETHLAKCFNSVPTMREDVGPVQHMLRLALATVLNHYKFYMDAARVAQTTTVKALLTLLAESEEEVAGKIEEMMARGIVEAVDLAGKMMDDDTPDGTPFDLARAETDPRLFVCNKALEQEIKAYTFFLSIAARARSEVISRLFQYFAHVKSEQIARIRRVCETF
ncbi:MAG: hypothetical protein ACP6IT_00675 [Candidatus Thorarchaeota archaeon]